MKKLIVLLIILLVAFVVVERKRVFVRDPLASVTRAGEKVSGEHPVDRRNLTRPERGLDGVGVAAVVGQLDFDGHGRRVRGNQLEHCR